MWLSIRLLKKYLFIIRDIPKTRWIHYTAPGKQGRYHITEKYLTILHTPTIITGDDTIVRMED